MTSTPIAVAMMMLCLRVNRKSFAWSATDIAVAAAATAMFCTLIILPTTPPAELAAAMSVGEKPRRLAVATCKVPNSAFAVLSHVSGSVTKTRAGGIGKLFSLLLVMRPNGHIVTGRDQMLGHGAAHNAES